MKGYCWYKQIRGRKRHLLVDTEGFVLVAQVTSAAVFDNQQLLPLLAAARGKAPHLRQVWVDKGYQSERVRLGAAYHYGVQVEVVQRPAGVRQFHLLPRRWVVERTFA